MSEPLKGMLKLTEAAEMNKTDATLKKDIEDELAWDPAVRSNAVGVAVKDGVATLTRRIDTCAEKHAIEKALKRVTGVHALALELDVRLSPEHRRSDTHIAQAVESALKRSTLVPFDRIRATVDKGWVTLHGALEWDELSAAQAVAWSAPGVRQVVNELKVL